MWTQSILGIPATTVPSLTVWNSTPRAVCSLYSHDPIAPSILSKVVGRQTMPTIMQSVFLFGRLGVPLRTTGVHQERDKPSSNMGYHEEIAPSDHSVPSSCIICPTLDCRPHQQCENTKPKTSFVEPQGTTTPNHFSSKPFARHTNTNQPRRMAVFQSLSICYF